MGTDSKLPARSSATEVAAFLAEAEALARHRAGGGGGRLIFALDATASREPTWDRACQIQGTMFEAAAALGGLRIQLCYYRGFHEFLASPWLASAAALHRHMAAVRCAGGTTQIERVLRHAAREARAEPVDALVFVGDCMEESIDALCARAGELGLLRLPVFCFHEGADPLAARAFAQIARLSGGACCPFDAASAGQLRELLGAVAVYAAGGRHALERHGGRAARLLSHQITRT